MASKYALVGGSGKVAAQTVIEQRRASSRPAGPLVFPSNIGPHSMLLRFFEYQYGGTMGSTRKSVADIVLPLPRQLQDSFKVNVGGDELGIIGDLAAQAAGGQPGDVLGVAKKLGEATVQSVKAMGTQIIDGNYAGAFGVAADAGQFLVRAGLGSVAPDISNGISAGRGTAINPFATLVFKGVDLKAHTFELLLSPESQEDSRTLKNIIRTIQRMVLPEVQSAFGQESTVNAIDRGILRYPAMVDVTFQGIDMNYYYKLKTSMISQFSVDYTPNGLAINRGGRPSVMRLSMTLQEAHIHTAEDYRGDDLDEENAEEKVIELIERQNSSSSDAVNNSGRQTPTLGVITEDGESVVSRAVVSDPSGQGVGQATSGLTLSDEITVGLNVYTLNNLLLAGVTRAEILANPSVYVQSSLPVEA